MLGMDTLFLRRFLLSRILSFYFGNQCVSLFIAQIDIDRSGIVIQQMKILNKRKARLAYEFFTLLHRFQICLFQLTRLVRQVSPPCVSLAMHGSLQLYCNIEDLLKRPSISQSIGPIDYH